MNKTIFKISIILLLLIGGIFALAQDPGITPPTPPELSVCGEGTYTITVVNDGDTPITNVVVVATVPVDYSYRGSTNGVPHGNGSTWASPTVTWGSFTLAANDYAAGGLDEWSATVTISPNCDAIIGRTLNVSVTYDDPPPIGNRSTINVTSAPITVLQPYLVLNVNPLVQPREVGDTASWTVTVRNTGVGDMYNVQLNAVLGAGLINLNPVIWPISLGDIDSGDSSAPVVVTADVNVCEDIYITFTATNNNCGEAVNVVCDTVVVEGSIELDYNTPNLDYSFSTDPIDIPYCGSDNVIVTVNNSGADAGNIRNFVIGVTLQPLVAPRQLDLSIVGSTGDITGVTYDNINNEFVIPDMGPNTSGTFTFMAVWNNVCAPVDCTTLIFEPHFTDDCGDDFYPPVKELPVNNTPPIPDFTLTKTGPGVILDEGDTGTFSINARLNAPNAITTNADIIDSFPPGFTAGNPSGTGVVNNFANTVTWTNEPFTGGTLRTFTFDLTADYAGTDCAVGIDNDVLITNIDDICTNCSVADVNYTLSIMDDALLEVAKSGPNSLHINGVAETYVITVTYDGPLCNFGSGNQMSPFTVTDTYPTSAVITANPDGGTIDTVARTITWTFPASAPPAGPPYTFTLTYDMRISSAAPDYDPCICGTIQPNSVLAELTDAACIVCSAQDTLSIAIECDDELTAPIDVDKTPNVNTQELCECIDYTNTIDFNVNGLTWSDIDFTENGDNLQEFATGGLVNGDIIVEFYDDSTGTTHGPDTFNSILDLGFPLNLGFLTYPDPDQNDWLTITYTICLVTNSTVGDFVSWTDITVDGYDNPCFTDDDFHEGTWINAFERPPDMGIAFFCHYVNNECSFVISECEEAVFRLNIDQTNPSYDVVAEVNLQGNYDFVLGTSTYSGILSFLNGPPALVPVYDPVAGTITWNIGEVSGSGTGYVQFNLYKDCDDENEVSSTVTFSDNCFVPGTPVTDTYSAYRTWGGELLVKKTPEVIFTNDRNPPDPEWILYITNRGSGTAYNVNVVDILRAGITYDSASIPPTNIELDTPGAGETTLTWWLASIDPGATEEIILRGTIVDCDFRDNEVRALWGCGTPTADYCFENCCEDLAPVTSHVEDLSTRVVITDHSNTPIDICGDDSTITIRFQNIGDSDAYDMVLSDTLPASLDWVTLPAPGYTVDCAGAGDCSTNFTYNAGTRTLTWEFIYDPLVGNSMAPGDVYTITFAVDPGNYIPPPPWPAGVCDFVYGEQLNATLLYSPPCGYDGDSATHNLTATEVNPELVITKTPDPIIGSPGNTVTWTINIENVGDIVAPYIELWDVIPSNIDPTIPLVLTPVGGTPFPLSGTGTAADPWVFANTDEIDVGAANAWVFTIDATVLDCDDSATNTAWDKWGCCAGETSSDTTAVITSPIMTLDQSIGGSGTIDNCGGTLIITITNDGADARLIQLQDVLPPGFIYEAGSAVIIRSSGAVLSHEPAGTTTLTWGLGNFTTIDSGETITITFNILHQSWGGGDCSFDPGGNNVVTLDFDDDAICVTTGPFQLTTTEVINPAVPIFTVTKDPERQTVPLGGTASWTITVTETNGGVADGTITIKDTLGPDYDMSSVPNPLLIQGNNWVLDPADVTGHTIMWTGLSIRTNGVGASFSFNLSCDPIANPNAINLNNVVDISGMCGVACVYSDATDIAYVGPDGVTKTIVEPTATIGEVVHVDITVNFFGSSTPYQNITIQDVLPAGLAYYGNESHSTTPAGPPPAIGFNSATMTWTVADFTGPCFIDIGFDAYVTNIASNQDGVTLTNTVNTNYDIFLNGALRHFTDSDNDTIDVIESDLNISKTNDTGGVDVEAGDTITYTISVDHDTILSNADAFDVVVTDTIPAGLTYVNNSLANTGVAGSIAAVLDQTNPAILSFSIVNLPDDGISFLEVEYQVTVDDGVFPDQNLINSTHLEWTSTSGTPIAPAEERTGTNVGPNDYFDDTSNTVTVVTGTTINKTPDGGNLDSLIPYEMTYTITIDLPVATIPTLDVTDVMGAGIYYINGNTSITLPDTTPLSTDPSTAGPNDGTASTTLGWTFNNLDATSGNPLVIIFNAVVSNTMNVQDGLIIGNTASYDFTDAQGDHHTGNDASRNLRIREADLSVDKSDSTLGADVAAGDTITYTIRVEHTGASTAEAYDIEVIDTIPAGLTYVGGSLTGTVGSVPVVVSFTAPDTISFTAVNVPLVPAGSYAEIEYQVTVDDGVIPDQAITNTTYLEWTSWPGTPAVGVERTGVDGSGAGNLNNYADDDSNTVNVVIGATIEKEPDVARDFEIGVAAGTLDVVPYTITITLPQATIPTLVIRDFMGEGLYYQPGSATINFPNAPNQNIDPALTAGPGDGTGASTYEWSGGSFNSVDASNGAPLIITFNAIVADAANNNDNDLIPNSAWYEYTGAGGHSENGSNSATDIQVHAPAFTIDKSVADIVDRWGNNTGTTAEVQPGDVIHYSLVINNVGSGDATNVVVTDNLPQHFEYDSSNPVATTVSPNLRDLTWNIGNIAGGGSRTIDVYARVTSGLTLLITPYDNDAYVVGDDTLGNQVPADNTDHVAADTNPVDFDDASVTPAIPAFTVDKAVLEINGAAYGFGNNTIQPGDYVLYRLTVNNVGNGMAYDVGVYDDLPIGMTYSLILAPPSNTDARWNGGINTHTTDPTITGTSITGERLTWDLPNTGVNVDMPGGDTYTIEYLVHVDSNIIEGIPAVNYVLAYGEDGAGTVIPTDRNADTLGADTDATDDATTSIMTREPFLVTEKLITAIDGDATNTTIAVHGSVVDYSYTIENVGNGDAFDLNIFDTLPTGFVYVTGSTEVNGVPAADPVVAGNILSWLNFYPAPAMPFVPGATLIITFQVNITSSASGGANINTAVTGGMDGNSQPIIRDGSSITPADTDEDDEDTAGLFIPVNNIELTKDCEPRSVNKGGIVRYTVTFTNNRKSTLLNATLTDTMPAGFRYIPGTSLINGSLLDDPTGSNPYVWNLGTVAPESTVVIKYHALVTARAKMGINVNSVVLSVNDSSGKTERLTATSPVSIKGKKPKSFDSFPPVGVIPKDVGEIGDEKPGKEEEEKKERKPVCCLGVRKVAIKSQDFKNTLPGYPEIYYQTDIAMYGATELFMVKDYLSPLLILEGIDPEDKYFMTGLYNRVVEKLGEYAQYNLGNVVMKSELGIPFMFSPTLIKKIKDTGKDPRVILDEYLLEMAKDAGLDEVPDIDPIFLEYFGSYPYLEDKISDGELAWKEEFMDKNIMPAALGFTLLRTSFQIDQFLKSDDPTERFFGMLLLAQSMEKMESAFEDLAVTAEFSPPVKYFPHYSTIEIDENTPTLKYKVVDEISTLYDHVAMLWGLSKLRSVLIHSQDPKVRENIETIDKRMKESYKIIEKIHYNSEDKTFSSFHGPSGSNNDDETIKASDLAFTILALRSVYNDNRDLRLNSEDPKRKIISAADFMLEKLVSRKDGGVYTSYDYSTNEPDTGTRRTLLDNSLAIRALLTAYVITEDVKYREAAEKVYDWMLEELWMEEFLIFVDEEDYDYEVILTPQSIGALIAAMRELTLHGDRDRIYDYLDKMSYTTERILDQSQLQLYENRFFPWHAPLTLIPEDPNGRSYIKPIITPIRDKNMTRDLAPILVRKMVLNLTPAGAIASGDEQKVFDQNKWRANLRFETPDLIASTEVDDVFETDIGMYFSSLIYDYHKNLKKELPTFNPYIADPDIPHYAAYLSNEVARFNVKNLTLNSIMGVKLTESDVVIEMAKKKGVTPDEFVKDFVAKRLPDESESNKSTFKTLIEKFKGIAGIESRGRFEDIIYLEYAEGKPYYEEKVEEGWIEEEIDTSLHPSSIAQTMIRQIQLIKYLQEKEKEEPSDRLVEDTMKLVVVSKHRFLVDLTEKMKEEKLGFVPHEFELKWDKEKKRNVPVVVDKKSDLFDQVSLIWAMALWNKMRDEGLFDDYSSYLGDRKVDDELLELYIEALIDNHYDKNNKTMVTGSVDAIKVSMALDILTRIVQTVPEGDVQDKIVELIKAQADYIIDKMIDERGVIAIVDNFGKAYDELCEFESIGTHTIPLNALYRAYVVTGDKKYLDTALAVFLKVDEKKWDQQLGLYLSSGTIYDSNGKTKIELSYTNLDLIFTIMLIAELQPFMEDEQRILTAYHMTTFMNRILEIGSLERYPENKDEKEGRKESIEKNIYTPQIIRSVKIVVSESPNDGTPCGVFTFLVIIENYCVDESEFVVDNSLSRIRVEDTLADDFHYVPGSTTINGKTATEPIGSKKLNWYISGLRYKGRIVLRYQAVADCEIDSGTYENTLDVKSFLYYNGEVYPCDDLGVTEGVRITEELWTDKEEEENGICLPCNLED